MRSPPTKLLFVLVVISNSKLLLHPILPTAAIISPLSVHGYTIPPSEWEPVLPVPIALHDTERLYGAISVPGVDGGEVLRPMSELPQNLPQICP